MKIYLFPVWIIFKIIHLFDDKDDFRYPFWKTDNDRKYSEWVAFELEYAPSPIKALAMRVWMALFCISMLILIF